MSKSEPVNLPLVREVVKNFMVRPIIQRLHRKRVPFGERNWRRLFESDCEKALKSCILLELKVERSPEVIDDDGHVTARADIVPIGRLTQDWLQSLDARQRLTEYSIAVRQLLLQPSPNTSMPAAPEANDTTGRSAPTLMGR